MAGVYYVYRDVVVLLARAYCAVYVGASSVLSFSGALRRVSLTYSLSPGVAARSALTVAGVILGVRLRCSLVRLVAGGILFGKL